MDCGMTICEPNSHHPTADENNRKLQKTSSTNLHLTNQKLIIKHSCLKKLSLWGCSGLDVSFIWLNKFIEHVFSHASNIWNFLFWINMQALYLNCPQLNDLNLNSCRNLHPGSHITPCSIVIISQKFDATLRISLMIDFPPFFCTERLLLQIFSS